MKSLLLLSIILPVAAIAAPSEKTNQEILYLLDTLKTSDCTFIRNGKTYSGEKASDHLAGKYKRVKSRINSTEVFIDKLASESSMSGKPYKVNCLDHASVKSGEWLTEKLKEYRQSH